MISIAGSTKVRTVGVRTESDGLFALFGIFQNFWCSDCSVFELFARGELFGVRSKLPEQSNSEHLLFGVRWILIDRTLFRISLSRDNKLGSPCMGSPLSISHGPRPLVAGPGGNAKIMESLLVTFT